jgi:hypothetical protein
MPGYVDHPQHFKQLGNDPKIPAIFLSPTARVIGQWSFGKLKILSKTLFTYHSGFNNSSLKV